MDGVHAWAGVIFGSLLFAIFLMGTLAVFDREIDRWSQPHTRIDHASGHAMPLDSALPHLRGLAPERAAFWLIYPPSERVPTLRLGWSGQGVERGLRDLHPATGDLLPERGAPLGTQLFYPFHYSLHLKWVNLGEWIVGLAAMAMLVTLVSGVATHRRIFKDFFTFRPGKALQRSALDLHNVSAVFALPFHFVIALSGLIIFAAVYLQPAIAWVYGDERGAFAKEVLSRYSRTPAKRPLTEMVSIDALAERSRAHWAAAGEPGDVQLVIVRNPRDAHAVIEVRRAYGQRVALEQGTLYFDAGSGTLLHAERLPTASRVQRFIAGMHLAQFDHWTLRWLYFLMGLGGCAMIATGSIVWVQKRADRHARLGLPGASWVQALNVASVAGLLLACTAVMLLNTLPHDAWTFGASPMTASLRWFFGLWGASLLHAIALRAGTRHWLHQCVAVSAVAAAAALAAMAAAPTNGLRTWENPAALGVTLGLLVVSAAAGRAAWRLQRRGRVPGGRRPAPAAAARAPSKAAT